MSRTYRRTTADWYRWKDCPEWEYRSDKWMTMQQVPKWYKVMYCRKPFRHKSRLALNKALRGDLEPTMPIDKKTALYYW